MGFNFGFRSKTQISPKMVQIGVPTDPLRHLPAARWKSSTAATRPGRGLHAPQWPPPPLPCVLGTGVDGEAPGRSTQLYSALTLALKLLPSSLLPLAAERGRHGHGRAIAKRWSSAQPLLCSTSVPTECVTAFASPCSAPHARLPRLPVAGAPRRRRGRHCSACSRGPKATVHLRSCFHLPWVRVDKLELEPPSSATVGPLRPTSATTGRLPCLASKVEEEGRLLFPLCLYGCMTSGPGWTAGPACRLSGARSGVSYRVDLANSVG
jgi:hypothetical protein